MALFCFAPKMAPLGIILSFLIILYGFVIKELSFKLYKINLLLIGLYLLYLMGIAFTNHPNIAWGYAENKLSFLIFPLLFSFKPKFEIKLGPVLLGLCFGLLIAYVLGIINALDCYSKTDSLACLTSVNISPIHHPSYFAIFILISTLGAWKEYLQKNTFFNLKWLIPFSVLSLGIFTLCMSLAAVLFLVLLILVFVLVWIYKNWGKMIFYPLLIIIPFLAYISLTFLPIIKDEFKFTQKTTMLFFKGPTEFVKYKQGDKAGNEVRLIMWTVTIQEIAQNPFGVGTGNMDDYLSKRLKSYGQDELGHLDDNNSLRYNPHNQLLQTTLEIGLIGGVVLTMFVISALILAWKRKNLLFSLIVTSLIFNGAFESMLQRQSGIIFYSFWICFFVMYEFQNGKKKVAEQ